MKNYFIKPTDVFEIIQRQQKRIIKAFAIAFASVMLLFIVSPRTYQVESVVHISVNYFQNPLINDLVSQTHDPNELRSEREKIIKASLGVEFAKRMAEKFKLFNVSADSATLSTDVEYFLKSLDISPLSATQFTIKYKARTPEIAMGVINAAVDSIREHMYISRVQMLEQFLGILQNEISGASDSSGGRVTLDSGAKSEIAKAQVKSQIKLLEDRQGDLLRTYNEQHPSVQAIKNQISELKSFETSGVMATHLTRRKVFTGAGASALGMLTIKDDLTKQRHLVNISLEMEKKDPSMSAYVSLTKEPIHPKKPIFPKFRLFLLMALITGVLASTATAAIFEFWGQTKLGNETVTRRLGTEVLGTIRL